MNELMSQAIDLMVAGMGFVFAFLIILVFATLLMSKLVLRFGPAEPEPAAPKSRAKPSAPSPVDPDTAEAIKKAIAQYRSRHKK
ncbi:sodium pump decarboxylase subunit gamma [Marinobacter panjinensis]|uniref:Probable oxaloacetate decarboxylase gamma chain n=1 Tax=Marinobacter panjinensis TaxID=2576384 RepID=A0A4U6QZ99_9GAMM|nr:OadG family transporter subunit [Marinobacter panjinensis]MCR8915398.1 OadG family transporter subunit [Marinobacter panjinensis]TKV66657.1 sodium pump decarboxylase subunit gamma [Marinobacter panjinensis]